MYIFRDKHLRQLSPNIYLVTAPQQGRFPYCHCFLFIGDENILIDAGIDEDLLRKIDDEIQIDTLLISHTHPDHIRCWQFLRHRKLIVPNETPDSITNLPLLAHRYTGSMEEGYHWIRAIGEKIGIHAMRTPDMRFGDGDVFENGNSEIVAIYAPGHFDDHYCFFERRSGLLITTDIDFSSFGPWYGNPQGNINLYKKSIRKIMALPYKMLCPSHKLPLQGDSTERFNRYLAAFDKHKNKIYRLLGKGRTLAQIVDASPFYNNKFMDPVIQNVFERNMVMKNLDVLIEEEKIRRYKDIYVPRSKLV